MFIAPNNRIGSGYTGSGNIIDHKEHQKEYDEILFAHHDIIAHDTNIFSLVFF